MPTFHDCLPIPLTPFEQYMVADDRIRHPMTFFVQLEFSGEIDVSAFEGAVSEVLSRHPLLGAKVQRSFWRVPRWESMDAPRPTVDWGTLEEPIECAEGEYINLRKEVGFRIWGRIGPDRIVFTSQFHHACCDGVGAFQFWGDLLAAYGVLVGQEPLPLKRTIRGELLRGRQQLRRGARVKPRLVRKVGLLSPGGRVRESLRALSEWPIPLRLPENPMPSDGLPGICCRRVPLAPLRSVAKSLGVTLNDLLLRDLFLALGAWETGSKRCSERSWRRITMPTNLRGPQDRNCPVTNILGYAFITRRHAACQKPDELLEGIHRDTQAIWAWDLGAYFPAALATVSRIKGAMSLFASSRRCLSTAVLSNLGDPTRRFVARLPRQDGKVCAGNMKLERMLSAPPLRPRTHAAFLALTYRDELTICVRCNPHVFSESVSGELLDGYLQQLEVTAQKVSP